MRDAEPALSQTHSSGAARPRADNLQGMAWMACTAVMIVLMHTLARSLTDSGVHPLQIVFYRSFFGLPVLVVLLARYGWGIYRTDQRRAHMIRSCGHVAAMTVFFFGLSMTPLAQANALAFTAPLFAGLLAVLFLGERFRLRRWSAMAIGFAGMLVIVRPGLAEVGTGPLICIVSSLMWGSVVVIIKSIAGRDATPTIVAYMLTFMTPIALVPALFVWSWPTWEQLPILVGLGLLGTLGHLTMTQALRLADTSVVMPVDFSKLLWASLFGYFLFGEVPDIFTWIGGTMIFAGATYLALRERREAKP